MIDQSPLEISKMKTGIPGFDSIANGGLPQGRTTLVAGTAGSGKTVFASQFLVEGITHNVVILRNVLEAEKRRRTIEILKFRGTSHKKGEFPFTISPQEGIIIIPLSELELKQKSSDIRVTSGNEGIDEMCGGGFFRDSIILVSGATGTGKTLMTTEFSAGGANNGERCLLFSFEESRDQLFRNAIGWGIDVVNDLPLAKMIL